MKTLFTKKIVALTMLAVILVGGIVIANKASAAASANHSEFYIRIDGKQTVDMWGDISEVGTNWVKVRSWGGVWTVNVASTTDLRRKFEGKSSLKEFMAGDRVQVKGTAGSDTAMIINAKKIQNFSIQTKDATFNGTIGTTTTSGFSFTTSARGVLQVTYASTTKITDKFNKATSTALIKAGTKASIFGVWNRQSTILQAREIKLK